MAVPGRRAPTAPPSTTSSTRGRRSTPTRAGPHFDARFGAARTVTGVEDFPESERIHRNLATGTLTHTNPGRNEPGIVHFHETLAALLGDGRPERAEVP